MGALERKGKQDDVKIVFISLSHPISLFNKAERLAYVGSVRCQLEPP